MVTADVDRSPHAHALQLFRESIMSSGAAAQVLFERGYFTVSKCY